ncbi:hypothetical protein DD594_26710 [Enterobacter cloacae complex sp. 4DZ1-17B1]|nr:hypothetical protein DD594_26710 [Enterobacter cloacae complex sp. 4DZ1-17B1]
MLCLHLEGMWLYTSSLPNRRSVDSWNALIARFAPQKKALHCFQQMQSEGLSPDASPMNHEGMWIYARCSYGHKNSTSILLVRGCGKKILCLALFWSICMPNVVHLRKYKKCWMSFLSKMSSLGIH